MESKKDKFIRLAESRTNKVIEGLVLLSNLSSLKNYEYELDQIKQIFKAIDKQLNITKAMFRKNEDNSKFRLKK